MNILSKWQTSLTPSHNPKHSDINPAQIHHSHHVPEHSHLMHSLFIRCSSAFSSALKLKFCSEIASMNFRLSAIQKRFYVWVGDTRLRFMLAKKRRFRYNSMTSLPFRKGWRNIKLFNKFFCEKKEEESEMWRKNNICLTSPSSPLEPPALESDARV